MNFSIQQIWQYKKYKVQDFDVQPTRNVLFQYRFWFHLITRQLRCVPTFAFSLWLCVIFFSVNNQITCQMYVFTKKHIYCIFLETIFFYNQPHTALFDIDKCHVVTFEFSSP